MNGEAQRNDRSGTEIHDLKDRDLERVTGGNNTGGSSGKLVYCRTCQKAIPQEDEGWHLLNGCRVSGGLPPDYQP